MATATRLISSPVNYLLFKTLRVSGSVLITSVHMDIILAARAYFCKFFAAPMSLVFTFGFTPKTGKSKEIRRDSDVLSTLTRYLTLLS